MSNVYDPELRKQIQSAALKIGKKIQEGVYIGVLGPSYETPAEIRAFRTMGADAVGMSTVPEVIAAGHAGLKVAGISCLCNMGAGMLPIPLDHHEVLAAGQKSAKDFESVVRQFIKDLVL
jgi:purine-nucleoside phosphorylase